MLEIKVTPQLTKQKTIETEVTWVDLAATSGHFMNNKVQTAEIKEANWSAHNSHTYMNVCMHEIIQI